MKEYTRKNPKNKAPQIADALGLTTNTVRKCLKMEEPPHSKDKKVAALNKVDKVHFLSVSSSQIDISRAILAIHLPNRQNFQCDLTAWKLGFYKNRLSKLLYCYDKYVSLLNNDEVKYLAEFEADHHDSTFQNIIIDLPCLVETPLTKSRFDVSTHFSSLPELLEEHAKMLRLSYRKMQTDGILVYKTMDFTFNNTPY